MGVNLARLDDSEVGEQSIVLTTGYPIRLPDKGFKCLSSRSSVELFLFVMQCFCVRSAFGGLFPQKVIVQGQCSLK